MYLTIMSCSTEVEYISIHEMRTKRRTQRFHVYSYKNNENITKACLKRYYNNYEYFTFQKQLYKQNARRVKQEKEANNDTNNDN